MKVDVILGLQWGDEGKGKIVDVFAPRYDIVARFQGGPNAGHTVEFGRKKFILHTIPSGIFHPTTTNVIGNGVIIDPFNLVKEIKQLKDSGINPEKNLLFSKRAHLILPSHRVLDIVYESLKGHTKIGSTLKGIGPTYTDKAGRNGLRIGTIFSPDFPEKYRELKKNHEKILDFYGFNLAEQQIEEQPFAIYEQHWFEALSELKSYTFIGSEDYLNKSLDDGRSVLAEGAQGSMLDIDFGSYPYVTSSNTISAGVCSGLGISPHRIGKIYGIFKSYCTRVGAGPFPTELCDDTGERMRNIGREFGSTTGRPRRCGWLDLPALKYSIMLNGVDSLIMMKADVLSDFEKINVCTHYKVDNKISESFPFDLSSNTLEPVYDKLAGWQKPLRNIDSFTEIPKELTSYLKYIEDALGLPIDIVSIGPDRTHTLVKQVL
jgi:adenylosuccinate synthase